jgi:hypothetical protein
VLVGKSQVNEVSVKMREYAWQEFYVLFWFFSLHNMNAEWIKFVFDREWVSEWERIENNNKIYCVFSFFTWNKKRQIDENSRKIVAAEWETFPMNRARSVT